VATTSAPDGTSIHYEVIGAGDPMLLIHGLTESGEAWGDIPERLAPMARVVVVDLPGHGRSGRAPSYGLFDLVGAVGAVVAAESLEKPRVVGHSLGGTIASALAVAVPVQSVVNVDQPLRLDDFQAQLQSVATALRDPESFPEVMHAILDGLMGDALPPAEVDRIRALRRLDQDVVLGVWSTVLDTPAADLEPMVDELTRAIRVPYLSLHGSDPGRGYARWLTDLVPHAAVDVWPGLGHYPHLVDPDRFLDRLEDFWTVD
jgi:pimeloyl-ACP methyl ester carboxylesterase